MKVKSFIEIIDSLPLTDSKIELVKYNGIEILEDIMDFLEIRFPQWKEDLKEWSAEFILSHIERYIDIYQDSKGKKHTDCLGNIYLDINDSYYIFINSYEFCKAIL